MNPENNYRIWSLTSQKFLVLKTNDDNTVTVDCTGTGQEQSGKLLCSEVVAFQLLNTVNVEKNMGA